MEDSGQRQRDIVFCHECENEWYRDEHGLSCPRCRSDFCEVVEAGHDPREEQAPELPQRPEFAPDPGEDDIREYDWDNRDGRDFTYRNPGQQQGNVQGADERPGQQQHQGQQGGPGLGPFVGQIAQMVGGILGGRPVFPTAQQAQDQGQQPGTGSPHSPRSTPGSPGPGGLPGGTRITTFRSGGGSGFQWSITTSSGGSGFQTRSNFPMNATGPQGIHNPNQDFMQFMLNPPGHLGGGQRQQFHFGPGGNPQAMEAFGPLFAGLFGPAMMRNADGVYSQEALDRIISQLMEQNASGNAPGPAPAEAIASLPIRDVNEKDLGSEGKAECSICMDEVSLGEKVTELPCHHWFHGECIKAWLSEHDTCPHCRQGILPQDGPEDTTRARTPHERPRHDQMWGQSDGSNTRPYVVPDSPERPRERRRHSSTAGSSGRRDSNSNDGLLSRMRNAFGGGHS